MSRDEEQLTELMGRLAERQPATGVDDAWLRDRMRRHRGRQGAIALAVVAAVTTLALPGTVRGGGQDGQVALPGPSPSAVASPVAASPEPLPVPPSLSTATAARLLVVQGTTLTLLDVDSGEVAPLETDPRLVDHDRLDVIVVGSDLVIVGIDGTGAGNGPNRVYATTDGPGSALRQIGEAGYLNPSAEPGRVWLESIDDGEQATTTLREVDLKGEIHQEVVLENTLGARPFGGGFLRNAMPANDVELVDAEGTSYWKVSSAQVNDVSLDVAVVADRECRATCRLHIQKAGANLEPSIVQVDDRVAAAGFQSAVEPGGRRLLSAVVRGGPEPALDLLRTELSSGDTVAVPGVTADGFYGFLPTFAADGRWAFWVSGSRKSIEAFDLDSGRAYRTGFSAEEITSVVALSY